ncbi:DUF4129 domain-containing protein [Actinomadura sp. 9N215]|uniref:DUF4129 domain-containing protein n=1 Tax=Actinomadura sp. 9N215 TaxID=3375150 RepID=UPI0037A29CDF
MAPHRTPTRREFGRAGAAALLLAGGAYGVRGLAGLWSDLSVRRPSTPSLIAFAVLLTVAAALVAAALHRRREPVSVRRPHAGLVLLVVGLPIAVMCIAFTLPRTEKVPKPKPKLEPGRPSAPWTVSWPVVAAVLALAVIALVAWTVVRRRLSRLPVPAAPPPPDGFEEAAAAGSRALRSTGDPRAAVIACYAAMEGVLAEAGAAPLDSDTPAEVLARASGSGLDGLDAATALTALFTEARYSVHPVTERHRAEALAALESLRARSRA